MITDPIAMNRFFVNLDGAAVLGVEDAIEIPEVHVELVRGLAGCPTCGVVATVKDRRRVALADLSMAGRQIVLVWNKRRFHCVERFSWWPSATMLKYRLSGTTEGSVSNRNGRTKYCEPSNFTLVETNAAGAAQSSVVTASRERALNC